MDSGHQGCSVSMVFMVAFYAPCRYLDNIKDMSPQLHADDLECSNSYDVMMWIPGCSQIHALTRDCGGSGDLSE